MRHSICAALVACLAALPLYATETHSDRKAEPKAAAESGHRRMADRMKEKLGLNDEQAEKLDAAWQAHREAVKPLREQLHKALRKVHGQLEIEASDKDIQAALDQVEKARGSLRAEADQFKKTMEAMLTPTQREKMMRRGMAMGHSREGWRARGRDEDRGAHHGSEGRWGQGQDQESQEPAEPHEDD